MYFLGIGVGGPHVKHCAYQWNYMAPYSKSMAAPDGPNDDDPTDLSASELH